MPIKQKSYDTESYSLHHNFNLKTSSSFNGDKNFIDFNYV